jgi:hypothetical protein
MSLRGGILGMADTWGVTMHGGIPGMLRPGVLHNLSSAVTCNLSILVFSIYASIFRKTKY